MDMPMRPVERHLKVREVKFRIQTLDVIIDKLESDGVVDEHHIWDVKAYLKHYRYMLNRGIESAELPVYFNELDKNKKMPLPELPE